MPLQPALTKPKLHLHIGGDMFVFAMQLPAQPRHVCFGLIFYHSVAGIVFSVYTQAVGRMDGAIFVWLPHYRLLSFST